MSDFAVLRPHDIAHELSIYAPTGTASLRSDPRTFMFMSSTKRLARFVGEREDSLRPKLAPGTHVGVDGVHERSFIQPRGAQIKSPWEKSPRLVVKVLPEHTLGFPDPSLINKSGPNLAPIFGDGYRAGVARAHKELEADNAERAADRAVPGPGRYEVQLAEKTQATLYKSHGAVGLGTQKYSPAKRFSPSPEMVQRALSPAPGEYGEPRGKAGVGGGVPRNPEWEWKREASEARLDPVFTCMPRDPTNPFRPVQGAPQRNFKRLATPERARVKAPG